MALLGLVAVFVLALFLADRFYRRRRERCSACWVDFESPASRVIVPHTCGRGLFQRSRNDLLRVGGKTVLPPSSPTVHRVRRRTAAELDPVNYLTSRRRSTDTAGRNVRRIDRRTANQ